MSERDPREIGVWCCERRYKCEWQAFALHQGLGWGEIPGEREKWREWHDRECGGRLIQLIPPTTTTGGDDMSEWQPIETAPIGQSVFAYHPMYGRFLGYKERIGETDFTQWCNWDGDKGILPPTHWMPIPPPPESE